MARMRWGWRGAFLVTIAAGLAGCATGSAGYSEPEQARVDAYERAAGQILQSRGMKAPAPVVRIGTDPTLAGAGRPAGYYTDRSGFRDAGRPGSIVVNHAAMADDFIAQAVLSQELAHYVLGHVDDRCPDRQRRAPHDRVGARLHGRHPAPVRLPQERRPGRPARGHHGRGGAQRPLPGAPGVRGTV